MGGSTISNCLTPMPFECVCALHCCIQGQKLQGNSNRLQNGQQNWKMRPNEKAKELSDCSNCILLKQELQKPARVVKNRVCN